MDNVLVPYQLQVVASVGTDVPHDVAARHPLGDRRKFPLSRVSGSPMRLKTMRSRSPVPETVRVLVLPSCFTTLQQ